MVLSTRPFLLRSFAKLRVGWVKVCLLAIIVYIFRACFIEHTLRSFFKSSVASRQTVSRNGLASPGHIRNLLSHINIKESLGKIIRIELVDEQSKQVADGFFVSLLVRVDDWPWPASTDDIKPKRRDSCGGIAKFVYVLGFWEQLSQSLISLLDLALLNRFTDRLLVAPRVCNSSMGAHGKNLNFYVNVSHLNKLLEESGVSGLVDEREFSKECGMHSHEPNLTVHFMYTLHWNTYVTANIGSKQTDEVMKTLRGKSWVDCTRNSGAKGGNREVCVNPLHLYHTEFLENDIFRNAKCVVFSEWRGLGDDVNLRLNLQPSDPLSHSLLIQSRLLFSDPVLSEARSFLETLDGSSFLAVHIRAERLFMASPFMAVEKLGTCLEILKETVLLIKSRRSIQNVFLSVDFGKQGSGTWSEENAAKLMTIHQDLVTSLNTTCYHPDSQSRPFLTDRGVVALVEMTIASSFSHIVTVGRGTFQDWLVSRFLRNTRRQGSVLRICSKAGRLPDRLDMP